MSDKSRARIVQEDVKPSFCIDDCCAGRFPGRCFCMEDYGECKHPNPELKNNNQRVTQPHQSSVPGLEWGTKPKTLQRR